MMYAGLAGSGILGVILGRSNSLVKLRIHRPIHPSNCNTYRDAEQRSDFRLPGVNHDILTEASYNSAKPPPWGVMPFNIIYLTTLTKK